MAVLSVLAHPPYRADAAAWPGGADLLLHPGCPPDGRPRQPEQASCQGLACSLERLARAPRTQPRLAALHLAGLPERAAGADGERDRGAVR